MISLRKPIRFISALMILSSLIIAMLLIPNSRLFDESLLPEIQELAHLPPVADKFANGVIYAYGIDAPEGVSPYAAGEEIMALMNKKTTDGQWGPLADSETKAIYQQRTMASLDPSDQIVMQKNFAQESVAAPLKQSHPSRQQNDAKNAWWRDYSSALDCNPFEDSGSFIQVRRQLENTPIKDMRLVLRLQRYRKFIQFTQFNDVGAMQLSSPLGTPLVSGRINLAQAYLNGNIDSFLVTVQQDIHFWLRVLRGSQSLMNRYNAINALRYNLQSLNTLINERELTSEQQQTIRQLLQPPQALDFAQVLRSTQHQFQALESTWAHTAHARNKVRWIYWLRQDNASANDYYQRITAPLMQLAQLKPADFLPAAKKLQHREHASIHLSPYNLGGKLLQENHDAYLGFFIYSLAAAQDTLAIYKLIELQLDITQKQPADISAFIQSAPQRNPYTQEAIIYNSSTGEAGFNCLNKKDNCTIDVRSANTISEKVY